MGVGEASLNVLLLAERLIDCPVTTSVEHSGRSPFISKKFLTWPKSKFSLSPRYLKQFPLIWYFGNGATPICLIYDGLHTIKLLTSFVHSGRKNLLAEELVVYIFFVAMRIMAVVTWYSIDVRKHTFCFNIRELFSKCQVRYIGWPSRNRLPDFQELLGYMLAFGISIGFPFFCGIFPLVRDYGPMSRLFRLLGLPFILRKLAASLFFTAVVAVGGIMCGTFILVITAGSVCLTQIAKENLETSQRGRRNLSKSLRTHTELSILIQGINEWLNVYIPTLQGIGLTFCIFANYTIIKYNDEPLFVIAALMLTTEFTVINMVLLHYASQPNVLTGKNIRF